MTVSADRLRDLTLELLEVASPTGDTRDVAELYARRLEYAGLEVELLRATFPETPTVIGRLRGARPGPTVALCAHLDVVPIPHEPARVDGDRIYGRGSADMKGAAASALEAARVLDRDFAGELAIVAIGLHEAPGGRGEDLTHLLENGFRADYALVCELAHHELVLAHMGQATAEITVSRPGMPTHEILTPAGTPHPLHAAARLICEIANRNLQLAIAKPHPLLGHETYFVGEVHGGDFYNRFPASCRIVGTRRWLPGNTIDAVETEYRSLVDGVAAETGCDIELDLRLVRESYEIDAQHALVRALADAYREVTGETLEPAGKRTVADAAIFQSVGGIPCVYHGPLGSGAHADVEYVEVPELVRASEVYVALLKRLLQ